MLLLQCIVVRVAHRPLRLVPQVRHVTRIEETLQEARTVLLELFELVIRALLAQHTVDVQLPLYVELGPRLLVLLDVLLGDIKDLVRLRVVVIARARGLHHGLHRFHGLRYGNQEQARTQQNLDWLNAERIYH